MYNYMCEITIVFMELIPLILLLLESRVLEQAICDVKKVTWRRRWLSVGKEDMKNSKSTRDCVEI